MTSSKSSLTTQRGKSCCSKEMLEVSLKIEKKLQTSVGNQELFLLHPNNLESEH